ncbi:MAG: PIN domain-containing protein [Methanomassiliicoccales archaeon]|nr:PIN domain-containing protein [Methanomassiliicoccales archaeon]
MAQIVVVDTSTLISVFENRINFDAELSELLGSHDVVIPTAVLEELGRVKKKEAKMALEMSAKYRTFQSRKKGDDAIVEAAKETGSFAVVTNDARLASELVSEGFRVITLRARKRLDFRRSDDAI